MAGTTPAHADPRVPPGRHPLMHPFPTHRTVVSYDDLAAKYHGLAEFYAAMPSLVDGATMCRLVVADVSALLEGGPSDLVKLADAAKRTGYSRHHLRRMIKEGHLRTHRRGRMHYVRLADLRAKRGPRLESAPIQADCAATNRPSTEADAMQSDADAGRAAACPDAPPVAATPAETRLDVQMQKGYDAAADARRMAARGRGRKVA